VHTLTSLVVHAALLALHCEAMHGSSQHPGATVSLLLYPMQQLSFPYAAAEPLAVTHTPGITVFRVMPAVYEALKRGPAVKAAHGPPIYFSLTQVLEAPIPTDLVLPACFWAAEVSAALAAGINTAFKAQLTQNASVDTTYVQASGV